MGRTPLVLGLAAVAAGVPVAADGQLAVQRSNEAVLVLAPVPAAPADSLYAVQVGDAVRRKMEGKFRLKLRVIPKDKIAEALGSSGFSPDAILDQNGANQLARFMNVDAYITGQLERNAVPRLTLRLVDVRRSGLAGWVHVEVDPNEDVDDLANTVADSLDNQVKAAEQVRECIDRRDRQDFGSALDRAGRVFRMYPNHPGAALCAAQVYEAMKSPPDSQIVMLRRAVQGDSMLTRAWELLARQYQQQGDTAAWAGALIELLETNPSDMRMRLAAAALLYQSKNYVESAVLIDAGLERSPDDETALGLKARVCFEGQLWGCAVDMLGRQWESNPELQTDSLAMLQIFAAIQATNDTTQLPGWAALPAGSKAYFRTEPDSVAMVKWTEVAVQKFPNSVTFWRARASALRTMSQTDRLPGALRRVARLDPADFASRIQLAQIFTERAQVLIDSLTQLAADTVALKANRAVWERAVITALAPADTVLAEAEKLATEDTKVNVAIMYFTPATKLVQSKLQLDRAIQSLEKAMALDTRKQLATQANFFLGLAHMYLIQGMDLQGIIARKDCAGIAELERVVIRGKAAILAGASVQPETAQQLATVFTNLEKTPPQAKKAWNCR